MIEVVPSHAMKAETVSRDVAPLFLNSALDGVDWPFSRPGID